VDTESGGSRALQRVRRYLAGSSRAIGFMLLALGAIVLWQKLADPYGAFDPPGEHVLLAAGLIGGGILLLRDDPSVRGVVVSEDAAPKRPRTKSPLGLFTLAIAFVTVGAAIVAGNLSIMTLSIGQLTALTMIVVGVGLFIGAWWGRARWLIIVCALLVPIVMTTSYIDMPPKGRVGSFYFRPTSAAQIPARYNLLFGNMQIDLQGLRKLTGTSFLNLNVAAGNVTIYVPERVTLRVTGHIEYGNATLGRGYEDGEDLSFGRSFEGRPGQGTIDIDVNGGITSLYVERISRRERRGMHRHRHGTRGRKDEKGRAGKDDGGRAGKDDGGRAGTDRAGRERARDRAGRGER